MSGYSATSKALTVAIRAALNGDNGARLLKLRAHLALTDWRLFGTLP